MRVYTLALKRGDLMRPKCCTRCKRSAKRIDGHHPDYSKPLRVKWLCRKCHVREHVRRGDHVAAWTRKRA